MGEYRNLQAWQKAMDLADAIFDAVSKFPQSELYGLTAQMKSASRSVPSNIAEGRGRRTKADYKHFLYQARGSLHEVETQIDMARRQRLVDDENAGKLMELANETGRLLNGLIRSVS